MVQGLFDGLIDLVRAGAYANGHQCPSAAFHDVTNMGKIHVDQPVSVISSRYLNTLAQNVIGKGEGHFKGQIARGDLDQLVIGDHDQRSQYCLRFSSPSSVFFWRLPSSKEKGRVTMATVSAPDS